MNLITNHIGEIVSLIAGLLGGGAIGYKIGVKMNVFQIQKSGDHASQIQIGNINHHGNPKSRK